MVLRAHTTRAYAQKTNTILPPRKLSHSPIAPLFPIIYAHPLFLQALAEAFAAKHKASIAPVSPASGDEACPCSQSREVDHDPTSRLRVQTAALAELAAAPFMDNELFVLMRGLEQQLLGERQRREGTEDEPSIGGEKDRAPAAAGEVVLVDLDRGHTACGNPSACLDSLLTSRAYRVLADQSAEKGLDEKAAAYFEQAKGLVEDAVEKEGGRLPRPSRSVV